MSIINRKVKKIEYTYELTSYNACCDEFKNAWYKTDIGPCGGDIAIFMEQGNIKISYCPFCGREIKMEDSH